MISQNEDTGRLSRWDEKDFRGPLVTVSEETSPVFGGNGLWFKDGQYLRTCTAALGIDACDDQNVYQQFTSVSGGSFQLSLGVQTTAEVKKPQLLFSAENFGASNFQVWLMPAADGYVAKSGTRIARFGVSWAQDGALTESLLVSTCLSQKGYNVFTVQVESGAEPKVRYFKDGYPLSTSVDSKLQTKAAREFILPKNSAPFKAVFANCGESFKFGCGAISSTLPAGYAQCFSGKLGMANIRRTTMSAASLTTNVHQMMSDYLGISGGEVCGDGILGVKEVCDDGNIFSNDGCGCDCEGECPAFDPPGADEGYVVQGEGSGQFIGATRTITCADGYDAFTTNITPEETVECTPSLKWSASALTCRKRCTEFVPSAELAPLVTVEVDPYNPGLKSGAARLMSCKAGLKTRQDWGGRKSQVLRCIDGTWSTPTMMCEDSCGAHPALGPGLVQIIDESDRLNEVEYIDKTGEKTVKQGVSHGARFQVKCDGVNFFPSASISDVADKDAQDVVCRKGSWSEVSLECFKGCHPFEMPEGEGYEGRLVLATAEDYTGGVDMSLIQKTSNSSRTVLGEGLDTLIPHGSYAEVSCEEPSYSRAAGLPSFEKAFCANGQWTQTAVTCHHRCSNFVLPVDFAPESVIITDAKAGLAHGAIKRLQCAEGYSSSLTTHDLNGKPHSIVSQDVRCLNGVWEVPALRCHATCEDMPRLGSAYMIEDFGGGVEHGARRTVTCSEGYHGVELAGDDQSVVNAGLEEQLILCVNGKWTQRLIQCVRDCDQFPSDTELNRLLPGANIRQFDDAPGVDLSSTAHGATRYIGCDVEQFPGVVSVTASDSLYERVWCVDGKWSLPAMRCRHRCEAPFAVKNALMVGAGLSHGDTRTLTCTTGNASLIGEDSEVITCRDGQWTPSMIQCEPGCGAFPSLGHAYAVTGQETGTAVASKRQVVCATGYSPTGLTTATQAISSCLLSASGAPAWSLVDLQCGAACDEYNPGDGYETEYDGVLSSVNSEGAKRTVRCATGYTVFGGQQPATVQCAGGKWSGKELVCYKNCSEYPKLPATYTVEGEGVGTGHGRDIQCAAGFADSLGRTSEYVVCMNGTWSKRTLDCQGSCHADVLGALGLAESKRYVMDVTKEDGAALTHGARRIISCSNEFAVPAGAPIEQETVCVGGTWAPVSLQCAARCPPAADKDALAYTSYYLEQTVAGTPKRLLDTQLPGNQEGLVRALQCAEGYAAVRGSSPAYSVCAGARWSEAPLVCAKACTPPALPEFMVQEIVAAPAASQTLSSAELAALAAQSAASSNSTTTQSVVMDDGSKVDVNVVDALTVTADAETGLTPEDSLQVQAITGNQTALIQLTAMRRLRRNMVRARQDEIIAAATLAQANVEEEYTGMTEAEVDAQVDYTDFEVVTDNNGTQNYRSYSSIVSVDGQNMTVITGPSSTPPAAVTGAASTGSASSEYKSAVDKMVTIVSTLYAHGTRLNVNCLEKDGWFADAGSRTDETVCVHGTWTPLTITCQRSCPGFSAELFDVSKGRAPAYNINKVNSRNYFNDEEVNQDSTQALATTVYELSCADGYTSSQNQGATEAIRCVDPGCDLEQYPSLCKARWTPASLECRSSCPTLEKLTANFVTVGALNTVHGAVVKISCASGFSSASVAGSRSLALKSQDLVCSDGVWSPLILECEMPCANPSKTLAADFEAHGVVVQDAAKNAAEVSFPHGTEMLISCKDGNGANAKSSQGNSETLVCDRGSWTPRTLSCAKTCDAEFSQIDRAVYSVSGTGNTYGSVRQVECRKAEGYYPLKTVYASDIKEGDSLPSARSVTGSDKHDLVCQPDGNWSRNTLLCDQKCEVLETSALGKSILQGGYVLAKDSFNSKESFGPGDKYVVSCNESNGFMSTSGVTYQQDFVCGGGKWSEKILECRRGCSSTKLDKNLLANNANYNIYAFVSELAGEGDAPVVPEDLFGPSIVLKETWLAHGQHLDVSCAPGFKPSNVWDAGAINKVACFDGFWTPLIIECVKA